MRAFAWDPAKNEWLRRERGISFEEILVNIQLGHEINVLEHPNQERYPGQRISVVLVEGYVYLVPFVESETEVFLKTIIPSRKATREYLGTGNDET